MIDILFGKSVTCAANHHPTSKESSMLLKVKVLADHPEFLQLLASWLHDEWGKNDPKRSVEHAKTYLERHMNRDKPPLTLIGFLSGEPIATASLKIQELSTHPQYLYWLGNIYVKPEFRGQGIGSCIIEYAAKEALRLNVQNLYLYTSSQEHLYHQLGWIPIERMAYRSREIVIMKRVLETV